MSQAVAEPDFSQPCETCREGEHEKCPGLICGCIAPHRDDTDLIRGFKRYKRLLHPEREGWTKGGWVL